uniref:Uncharacterized protein n=1 Tax=feces metagenome TaxID=1861841 RepID=A0A7M2QN41_9ZZZZ
MLCKLGQALHELSYCLQTRSFSTVVHHPCLDWFPVYDTLESVSSIIYSVSLMCLSLHVLLDWFPVSHSFLCLCIVYIYRPDSLILLSM